MNCRQVLVLFNVIQAEGSGLCSLYTSGILVNLLAVYFYLPSVAFGNTYISAGIPVDVVPVFEFQSPGTDSKMSLIFIGRAGSSIVLHCSHELLTLHVLD